VIAMSRPSFAAVSHPRAGLSLLEVLVASGILVIGLTSIAAILPAAASRFGQATQADRGGMLAANAYAEAINRGLVDDAVFSVPSRACVFGDGLRQVPTVASAAAVTAVASGTLAQRIDPTNGFRLEDDLVYASGAGSSLPLNAFQSPSSTVRRFNPGLCWGAMISGSGNAAPGMPATLSIAVFKKDPVVRGLTLTGSVGSPMLQYITTATSGLADEAATKKFMPPCGFVLATTSPPQWLKVESSWTMPGPIVSGTEDWRLRKSYVVLSRNPMTSGTTLSVVGFDQLLRVDQYPVILD
jgi:hypothetical protein